MIVEIEVKGEKEHTGTRITIADGLDTIDVLNKISQFVRGIKRPQPSCCDNERRSLAGGCLNCGDPCL